MNKEALVALITPFDEDFQIDFYALGNIIDELLFEGCDGFIVCGTTGESATLTHDEKLALLDYVIDRTKGKGQIWFGCGSNNTAQTCQFVKEVQHKNMDGLLMVTPYYNKPSSEGIYQHYQAIAQASHLPIMVYNVPSRTGISLTHETLCELVKTCPNIVALKQASHDLDIVQQVRYIRPDFKVYSGEDGYLKEGLQAGMNGIISVMGHLNMVALKKYLAFYELTNLDIIDQEFKELASLLFQDASPAPLKYLLSKQGKCMNILRLPLTSVNQALACELDDYISRI